MLFPQQDAAIYAENGGNANGKGNFLFIGKNAGGNVRRSLLQFDIAGNIPAGSTITSVEMGITVANAQGTGNVARLLPLTRAWSEGPTASNPGGAGAAATTSDSTWTHFNFTTDLWATAGGDFDNSVLTDTTSISGAGTYTWSSSARLVSTVQAWLDSPANNHGWLVQGDEVSAGATAKQVNSGDNPANKPQLTISYLLPSYNPKVSMSSTFEGGRRVGEIIHYSVAVSQNLVDGDGSDIIGLSLGGSLSGAFVYDSGNTDNDAVLDVGETWVYTAELQVTSALPATLSNIVGADFSDERGDPHIASNSLDTQVLALGASAVSPTLVETGVGESAAFTIAVEHGLAPIARQWYYDDNIAPPVELVGEEGLTLSLQNLLVIQSGDYYCAVSTAYEAVESPRFTLAVHPRIPLSGLCSVALLALLVAGVGTFRLGRHA